MTYIATLRKRKQQKSMKIGLLFCMLFYKLMCELSVYFVISYQYPIGFPQNLDFLKYLNGLVWCIVLFNLIPHNKNSCSTFFLYLTFLIQIVPLAVIYGISRGDGLYFNIICIGFLFCVLIIKRWKSRVFANQEVADGRKTTKTFIFLVVFLLATVFIMNGPPPLTALDIYKVYEIRSTSTFHVGTNVNYLLNMVITVMIPLLIAVYIKKKKWGITIMFCAVVIALYLYTGHKTYLFSIPMVLICSVWAKSPKMYVNLFITFCIGVAILAIFAILQFQFFDKEGIFVQIHSLIVRRVIVEPASIKFAYNDYFSGHRLYGLYGLVPTMLLISPIPYPAGFVIGKEVSAYYFDYVSNASTGFLGEAVMHFGIMGVLMAWGLFILVIKGLDSVENRVGYQITLGGFVYFIFTLNDAPLFGSLLTGPLLVVILLIFFYAKKRQRKRKRRI